MDVVIIRKGEDPDADVTGWWKIEQLWAGLETDTLYVRYESDAHRIIGKDLLDQYSVRVTWPNGTVQTFEQQTV